jgi:thiamine biosynthesis lipoprotein ApbE
LHTENVFGGENFEALGKKGRGPPWKVALNTLLKELAEVTEDMGEF